MSNVYVHSIFALLFIKQLKKSSRAAFESQTQVWPRIALDTDPTLANNNSLFFTLLPGPEKLNKSPQGDKKIPMIIRMLLIGYKDQNNRFSNARQNIWYNIYWTFWKSIGHHVLWQVHKYSFCEINTYPINKPCIIFFYFFCKKFN